MRLFVLTLLSLIALTANGCDGGGGGGTQNQPPLAAFSVDIANGIIPVVVSFDASASADPDGTIASFEWDFDGDGTVDLTRSQSTAQFEYMTAGSFTATLRVVDQKGASATATRPVTMGALTVSDFVVEPGAAAVDAGSLHAASFPGGAPAAVAETSFGLSYFGADLPDGSDWNAPQTVVAADVIEPRVFAVHGFPAVLFIDPVTRSLMYALADNAAGTSWPPPIVVAADVTTLEIGFVPDIEPLMVNDRPAVVLGVFDGAVNRVLYQRADDALGAAWSIPAIELIPGEDERNPRALVANGRPAVFLDLDGGYHFLRAEDADGASWPAAAVVAELDRADRDGTDGVALLDGRPALAYGGDGGLFLLQATDGDGSAFSVQELPVDPDTEELQDVRLGFFGSRAVLSGVNQSDDLVFFVSTDATATNFSGPIASAEGPLAGDQFLLDSSASPGVLIATETGLLKFLRFD